MKPVLLCVAAMAACACSFPFIPKPLAAPGYDVPAGKSMRIVVLRPDVKVGSLTAGGIAEPNSDWTATARALLATSLDAQAKAHGNTIVMMPDLQGDDEQTVGDYQALFRAVSDAIVAHKVVSGQCLPTKENAFDWTLGPGASKLGDLAGGADYALLLYDRDNFATAGRKALQIFTLLATSAMAPAPSYRMVAFISATPRWSISRPATSCGSTCCRIRPVTFARPRVRGQWSTSC